MVIFFAGVGYQVALVVTDDSVRVGPFDGTGVGVVLGAAIGYVLGGVVGRLTGRSLAQAERVLVERSPEQVLAALMGSVVGVLLAAGLSWPLLLVGNTMITLPIFVFACVTMASLGYRVGLARRDTMLTLLGHRTGLRERHVATAALPRLLDTSVLIDGRIVDVVRSGFLHGKLLLCQPVLGEVQAMADSADDTRRAKGRRALEVLAALRREDAVEVEPLPDEALEVAEVDAKLVRIALDRKAALLTLDTNLAKVAALAGCRVMNLHALALALRPPVAAGDAVRVLLTRHGKEAGQAVGYLDDGTMVVVEKARERVGKEVSTVVVSVLTTANGRLVFARLAEAESHPQPARMEAR